MERDKLSGAAEISGGQATRFLKALAEGTLQDTSREILRAYPSMASLWTMANLAFLHGEAAASRYRSMEKAAGKVVQHGAALLEPGATVLTYSRSSTVKRILHEGADHIAGTICGEGRPNYEGRQLARELTGIDIAVRYATDAGGLLLVSEADVGLIGADALLSECVVNKTGSMALALAAEYHGVPLYVAASSYKCFPFVLVRRENPDEVWRDAPPGVTVENVYFETVPASLITGFITEHGVQDDIPCFEGRIADEIIQIKDELAEQYQLVV